MKGKSMSYRLISVGELGFSHGATYKDICSCAIKKGFDLCELESGLRSFTSNSSVIPHLANSFVVATSPIPEGGNGVSVTFRLHYCPDSTGYYATKSDKLYTEDQTFLFKVCNVD